MKEEYIEEFRQESVLLAQAGDVSMAQVARVRS